MRFTDDHTPTPDAAEAFESGRAYEMSRRELAEEAGYNPDDDTLTAGTGTVLATLDPESRARIEGAVGRAARAVAGMREGG